MRPHHGTDRLNDEETKNQSVLRQTEKKYNNNNSNSNDDTHRSENRCSQESTKEIHFGLLSGTDKYKSVASTSNIYGHIPRL